MKRVNDTNINTPDYWDNVYVEERGSGKRRIDNDRLESLVGEMKDYQMRHPQSGPYELLDVGCGDGELMRFVHAYIPTWSKSGIDVTPKAISFAQQDSPNMKFQVGNIYEIPFPENSFDIVFCGETLEHLDAPEAAIEQLFKVCKPGGRVVISTPNEHANYSDEHIHEFTVGECISMTSKHGNVYYDRIRVVCGGISVIWSTEKK